MGAARFLTGLIRIVKKDELSVIVNTGDDLELFGLHISPDLDIITYTLADIVDEEKGWGIRGDTFRCLEMLRKYGEDTWFCLGDRDLATHLYRTDRRKHGVPLSQITDEICDVLRLKSKILPMSNDRFETRITTQEGSMHFEEYFVKRHYGDEVLGVEFVGIDSARPAPGVIDAILDAEVVVVCPSNPIVSIGTILSVAGVRDALKRTDARVVAVSPIVAGVPLKGPADKMMRALSLEVSAYGVAKIYSDFLDAMVIDFRDLSQKDRIEQLGLSVTVTNTVMKNLAAKISLAKSVLQS